MLVLDPTIDVEAVTRVVDHEYGLDGASLTFVPEGGDSWCFRGGEWFTSVRRDRQGHVPAAYEAAAVLRDDVGLEFVLAPERGRSGRVVHDAAGRPVVVLRFVEGEELRPAIATPEEGRRVHGLIARLHHAHVDVAIPTEPFTVTFLDELDRGVHAAVDGAAAAGPYGEPVTDLVRKNRGYIDELRRELASVSRQCRADHSAPFVLTHGEPTNVYRAASGELLLIDWGDTAWGPPERDYFALREYGIELPRSTRGHMLRFYELKWVLGEIAEYVDQFTTAHTGNDADVDKWAELGLYLS